MAISYFNFEYFMKITILFFNIRFSRDEYQKTRWPDLWKLRHQEEKEDNNEQTRGAVRVAPIFAHALPRNVKRHTAAGAAVKVISSRWRCRGCGCGGVVECGGCGRVLCRFIIAASDGGGPVGVGFVGTFSRHGLLAGSTLK